MADPLGNIIVMFIDSSQNSNYERIRFAAPYFPKYLYWRGESLVTLPNPRCVRFTSAGFGGKLFRRKSSNGGYLGLAIILLFHLQVPWVVQK